MDTLGEWLPEGPEQPSNVCLETGGKIPVVLDFGTANTRIGLASQDRPSHSFLTRAAKFRDRRTGEQRAVVGNDIFLEPGSRNASRSPFDGPLLTNWDAAESVLDYGLGLIGYTESNTAPIAISEALLAPHLSHRTMQELLFEGYSAPRVAFGADVLGAANYAVNGPETKSKSGPVDQKNVLLVHVGAETMHVLPVIDGRPKIEDARRINWGGKLATDFLHELLVLKYPNFPVPVTYSEVEQMLRKHCFVAEDYRKAVRECMDVEKLADLERRIQAPLPDHAPLDTERLERQAERRRESGRRLQEQAAIARAERQERQQEELEQLQRFESELSELAPEDAEAHAHAAGFTNMVDVRRTVRQLNNTLRRARGEQIEDPEPNTPLLNIPDDQLDPEQLKEKRRQRLLRASYDARQRARAAKEAQRQAQEAAEAAEADWRTRDLRGWATAKRYELDEIMAILREREKLRRDPRLRFRQTLVDAAPEPKRRPPVSSAAKPSPAPASAGRGSTPAANATTSSSNDANGGEVTGHESENGTGAGNEPPTDVKDPNLALATENGGIGSASAKDTEIVDEDEDDEEEEEQRDYDAEASALKAVLLEYDPEFTLEDLGPKKYWHDSTVHKFLWGAHALDSEDASQQYQLNLNIERIRCVEPIFQPSIVGVDQAGLSEVTAETLHRYPQLSSNIRLSGGFARLPGLVGRLNADLRKELPSSVTVNINTTEEPEFDAWRGIAKWSLDSGSYVTRREYEENGPDFIKEHSWGNPLH